MIDLETLAASCATMADEIVARMPMAAPAGVQDGDETEGGKHYHRAAAPDDGGSAAEEE